MESNLLIVEGQLINLDFIYGISDIEIIPHPVLDSNIFTTKAIEYYRNNKKRYAFGFRFKVNFINTNSKTFNFLFWNFINKAIDKKYPNKPIFNEKICNDIENDYDLYIQYLDSFEDEVQKIRQGIISRMKPSKIEILNLNLEI